MSLKPDLGLHLLQEGYSPDVRQVFYDFRLFNLAILGLGQYSTMVEIPRGGIVYALSLDFDECRLEEILKRVTCPRFMYQVL